MRTTERARQRETTRETAGDCGQLTNCRRFALVGTRGRKSRAELGVSKGTAQRAFAALPKIV